MKVLIVLSWGQRELHEFEWMAPVGATVADTRLHVASVFPDFKTQDPAIWHTAIWGKPALLTQLLQEGDRIEWLRGLRVDPKVARRERFQSQGRRTAGLFANKRPGAKAGY